MNLEQFIARLRLVYELPPKQTMRKISDKLRRRGASRVYSPSLLEENPKYTQPQRMTNFLMRYEAIIKRQLPDWELRLEGRRVLEIGGGPMYGFGLVCLFRGAERYTCLEPEFNPALKMHPMAERFFWLSHKDLTALYGARMSYQAFRRAIDERIEVRPMFVEAYQEEGVADVVLSNSTLEHIQDLDGAFERLRACMAPGGQFLHLVDFGNHRDKMNPLGGLYTKPAEDYIAKEGSMINLKKPSDILEALTRHGFEASLVPYYHIDTLTETPHSWWTERYSEESLRLKVGFFVGGLARDAVCAS